MTEQTQTTETQTQPQSAGLDFGAIESRSDADLVLEFLKTNTEAKLQQVVDGFTAKGKEHLVAELMKLTLAQIASVAGKRRGGKRKSTTDSALPKVDLSDAKLKAAKVAALQKLLKSATVGMKNGKLSELLQMDKAQTRDLLKELEKEGKVCHTGERAQTEWYFGSTPKVPSSKEVKPAA